MDKSPWGLDKMVFGLVFAVVLPDIFKFICYENNNEINADAAGSGSKRVDLHFVQEVV